MVFMHQSYVGGTNFAWVWHPPITTDLYKTKIVQICSNGTAPTRFHRYCIVLFGEPPTKLHTPMVYASLGSVALVLASTHYYRSVQKKSTDL